MSAISDPFNITHPANFVLGIITGTIGAIGTPGNVFLMFLIASEYRKRKPYEWLLFLLALGDFILCINNMALEGPFVTNFNSPFCKLAAPIDYTFGTLGFLIPPVVAYNRYLSLYNNQKCSRIFTNRNVFIIWTAALFYCICFSSPFVLTGSIGQDDLGVCGLQMRNKILSGFMLFDIGIVGLSYVFLLYFSYKVINKVRNHKKQAVLQSNLQSQLIKESEEIMTAMLMLSAIPLVSQMPGVIVKTIHIFSPPLDPWISRMAISPFPSTSAFNAYITLYVIKEYRRKMGKVFRRKPLVTVAPLAREATALGVSMRKVNTSIMDNRVL